MDMCYFQKTCKNLNIFFSVNVITQTNLSIGIFCNKCIDIRNEHLFTCSINRLLFIKKYLERDKTATK